MGTCGLENPVLREVAVILWEQTRRSLESWIWDPVSPISVGLQALTSVCRQAGTGSG